MNYDYEQPNNRVQSRDLVLASNEFVFIQNKTSGLIRSYVGPTTATISQQEALVVFDNKTKAFKEVSSFTDAKQLCKIAPENWYVELKNPTTDNIYPEHGKASTPPSLLVGRKVNIPGPCEFALFPGQIAKVVRGHALRSNQYLLARVYEAESANKSTGAMLDANGNEVKDANNYVNGQVLVIKGTEISFYIPPTGIEVITVENNERLGYTREAITLERLEYCILKDESGAKRYCHGPAVVFPEPTETFVTAPKGGYIFKAIELSPISGIYVKIIAEYHDEKDILHPIGEELFITGKDQMIYYPRPEHAIINYDGKIIHHAIAIPAGEGRYVMNRLTGEIKTVTGPIMFLPDPRTEVIVKRKLSNKECALWYPDNQEVRNYNYSLNEKSVEKSLKDSTKYVNSISAITCSYTSLDALEANANISRGTSYTKPRTITIDSKFEGAVLIDVWTGYAVNVVSKNGDRKAVCGPQSILLNYDQTLETLTLSTDTPKTGSKTEQTVYLRYDNDKVNDIVRIMTKDFVEAEVRTTYTVSFDKEHMDKWFNVENYIKHLCDYCRTAIKNTAKNYSIEEFYTNYSDIVRTAVIGDNGYLFAENGMRITNCEPASIAVEEAIGEMMDSHQREMVDMALKLSNATKRVQVSEELQLAEQKEQELRSLQIKNAMTIKRQEAVHKMEIDAEISRMKEEESKTIAEARIELQELEDVIAEAGRNRKREEAEQELAIETKRAEIEKAKQEAYAKTVADVMKSITPGLIEAITSGSNADMISKVVSNLGPWALASDDENVSDVLQKLVKGTTLENVLDTFKN